MSALAALVTDALTTHTLTTHTLTASTAEPLAAGGGIIDTITSLNSSTQALLRGCAVTAAVLFVIMAGIKSRGGLAPVIIAGAVAAIFCYIVFNVTDLKDRFTNDINGTTTSTPAGLAPSVGQVGPHPGGDPLHAPAGAVAR